nr:immunoglobulin heavy chain junction region [Mus musculus]
CARDITSLVAPYFDYW